MVSFGYVKQNGLMEHNHYDRYNGRVNLTTELAKNLTLTTVWVESFLNGANLLLRVEWTLPDLKLSQVMHFVFPDYGQLNWKTDLTA